MINRILLVVLVLSIALFADLPRNAADPLPREVLIEKLKPYWGNGPDEDDIVEPQTVILGKEELADHYRWHISYMLEDDDKGFAYLLLPKPMPTKESKLPVILASHTTNGLGKDVVAGNIPDDFQPDSKYKQSQWQYGLELVRLGFVVVAYDMAGYGERVTIDKPATRHNFEHVEAFKQKWLKKWPEGKFPHYKRVWDTQRTLDMVCKFDFVDTDNIGMIGYSLGGWDTVTSAPYDQRIKAAVVNAAGGLNFMRQLWEDNEKLLEYLDKTSIQNLHNNMNIFMMLMAPRAMLYIKPYNDYVEYERAWANHLEGYRIITDYYIKAAGKGKDFKPPFDIYFHYRGHSFEQEARALAYAWLHKQLKGEQTDFPFANTNTK